MCKCLEHNDLICIFEYQNKKITPKSKVRNGKRTK